MIKCQPGFDCLPFDRKPGRVGRIATGFQIEARG